MVDTKKAAVRCRWRLTWRAADQGSTVVDIEKRRPWIQAFSGGVFVFFIVGFRI